MCISNKFPEATNLITSAVHEILGWNSSHPPIPTLSILQVNFPEEMNDLRFPKKNVGSCGSFWWTFGDKLYLLGGWPTPLKNYGLKVSDDDIPNMMGTIKNSCSKPPNRYIVNKVNIHVL